MVAAPTLEHYLKLLSAIVLCLFALLPATVCGALNVVIIEGLGGEARYAGQFAEQVAATSSAAQSLTEDSRIHVFRSDQASREAVLKYFETLGTILDADDQVVVYLIGHGSYDEYQYKFNIPGPDLSGADLAVAFDKLPSRNQVLINTSSASGGAVETLLAEHRVVISATRSGVERHATRFGNYFAVALGDPSADIDKNRIITAQEAFDFAARRVAGYFDSNGQLATEHPRLDGERADRFKLARLGAVRMPVDDIDLRELVGRRDAIAAQIDVLRLARDSMPAGQYQQQLLESMLELALAEEAIEERQAELGLDE